MTDTNNNETIINTDQEQVNETKYVDEAGNPIDPSLIDEFGNYIGKTQYVDEAGNPIDSSLVDEFGNLIQTQTLSAGAMQMLDKEMLTGMVTFDYNNVPITDIVNSIILDGINKGVSDIHFDPFEEGIKIRIRIDGELNDYSVVPLYVKKNMITRIKIISGMNITESRIPQDGAIRSELGNKTVDLRVSCLPTNMGEKIVIRVMDYSMSAAGVEALDFSKNNLEKVKKMLSLPNGIILVTGATGTGKSTTVYSMLQRLNVEGSNLITVEDPIEMNIGGINQVQAASEIGLDFATVLRSILRQDPDVIMIGEIRDDETARIAVRASITGHLVLSTIHTNNSLNTIERLLDMSVERYLLGSALEGIVSQKLSRRLCEKCKRLRPTTDYEKEIFRKALNKEIENIYEPVGCPECSRGYRGRIAIHEVLLLNQSIRDAITNGVAKNVLRQRVYGAGGTETMLQDGLQKVVDGKTSFEEILKLIDLDDDLGSGTQLGLDEQMDAAATVNGNNQAPTPQVLTVDPTLFENMFKAINKTSKYNLDDDEDTIYDLISELIKTKKLIGKEDFIDKINVILNKFEKLDNIELDKTCKNKINTLANSINNYISIDDHNKEYIHVLNRINNIFNLNIKIDYKEEEIKITEPIKKQTKNIFNEEIELPKISEEEKNNQHFIDVDINDEDFKDLDDLDNINIEDDDYTDIDISDEDLEDDNSINIIDDDLDNIDKNIDYETIDELINALNEQN